MQRRTHIALAVGAAGCLAVAACSKNDKPSEPPMGEAINGRPEGSERPGGVVMPTTPPIVKTIPKAPTDLPEVAMVDVNGTKHSLDGKVVVVNFWATWCAPCKKEIPDFSRIYDAYKDKGVLFLGVLADNPDPATLLNFTSDFEMSYPIVRANPDINLAFGYPDGLPTTFIYDRNGKQQRKAIGALSEEALRQTIEPLLPTQ